jgi:hypothetical protein
MALTASMRTSLLHTYPLTWRFLSPIRTVLEKSSAEALLHPDARVNERAVAHAKIRHANAFMKSPNGKAFPGAAW